MRRNKKDGGLINTELEARVEKHFPKYYTKRRQRQEEERSLPANGKGEMIQSDGNEDDDDDYEGPDEALPIHRCFSEPGKHANCVPVCVFHTMNEMNHFKSLLG
jgi:hypothetical protein